eukprot:TRINITY_DN4508_c0_g1_i1.p1 TRINITY_DN4508_c0_g1~~TRINITY_DN4508_c0_g1_i1.p1  ORF type:complete len:274 (-),score=149.48 TRINITY_DN4508_c0_g1_i1:87-908(-)
MSLSIEELQKLINEANTIKQLNNFKIIGVIPARYASTRFPAKPLVSILGIPMIQRTFESAQKSCLLDKLIVATDDERIGQIIQNINGQIVYTGECETGTDRTWEAVNSLQQEYYDIIVNIQGDQPCVNSLHIDAIIASLILAPQDCYMSAAAAPIPTEYEATSPTVSKVVLDNNNFAIYYSRSLIPHSKNGKYNPNINYLKNCGMYCFKRQFLQIFNQLPQGPLQNSEDLEQIKAIENGYKIKVIRVPYAARGVDTPKDLELLEQELLKQNNQ